MKSLAIFVHLRKTEIFKGDALFWILVNSFLNMQCTYHNQMIKSYREQGYVFMVNPKHPVPLLLFTDWSFESCTQNSHEGLGLTQFNVMHLLKRGLGQFESWKWKKKIVNPFVFFFLESSPSPSSIHTPPVERYHTKFKCEHRFKVKICKWYGSTQPLHNIYNALACVLIILVMQCLHLKYNAQACVFITTLIVNSWLGGMKEMSTGKIMHKGCVLLITLMAKSWLGGIKSTY